MRSMGALDCLHDVYIYIYKLNILKYTIFTVPIEKEVTRIDKNGEEITKNIYYILEFIVSARFMASLLSNFVNNVCEECVEYNVNTDMMIKKSTFVELNISIAIGFMNMQTLKLI